MEKIGWIGTGVLGTAIATRLLTQNVSVLIFNRTVEKARPLLEYGATLAPSPRALAEECTTIFLCLTGHDAQEQVIFDPESGIIAAGKKALCIVDISTISPTHAISIHQRLQALDISYMDAPVSGGPENARLGKLSCILSGPELYVPGTRALLEKFTASISYVGQAGNAQLIKVLNNLAESINLLGAAEVLSLGMKAGMDIQTLAQVLPTLRGYSTYMGVLLERVANPREDISFALSSRLKDLRLAHEVATQYAVPIPVGALAGQLFTLAVQQEGPFADQTACLHLYQKGDSE